MKNIKGIAFANDGNMRRLAITYDEVNSDGKVTGQNIKVNRVVTDEECFKALTTVETYAQSSLSKEE